MLREGYLFAQLQLAEGIDLFGNNLEDDHTPVSTCAANDDDDDVDDNGEIDEELDSQLAISAGRELLSEEKFKRTKSSIIYHTSVCQGQLNGRNGSVACTTISVVTGMLISSESLKEGLTAPHAKMYVGCIEIGNIYHGDNGFFFAAESMSLLPDGVELFMKEESNCFIHSLLPCLLKTFETDSFATITCENQTVCCIPSNGRLFFFDSHFHPRKNCGALISSIGMDNMSFNMKEIVNVNDESWIYVCGFSFIE